MSPAFCNHLPCTSCLFLSGRKVVGTVFVRAVLATCNCLPRTLFQDASFEVFLREERPLKRHPHHPTSYKVPLCRAYQDLYNDGLAAAHVSTSSCWSPPFSMAHMPFCKRLLLLLIHYSFCFRLCTGPLSRSARAFEHHGRPR